jgi:hypothetical protein
MEAADPFIIVASGVALSTVDAGVALSTADAGVAGVSGVLSLGTGNATNGNGDNWSY